MKTKSTTTRAKTDGADPKANTSIFGMDITNAAAAVGMSRAQFYRLYLKSGRLRAIKTGGRDRVIDVEELKAAHAKLRDELPRAEYA
jgi:transposase-like protein